MTHHCRHGEQHRHHHHHHVGLAEGISTKYMRKLQWVMLLAVLYLLSQTIGSFLSGSLALLADAGHKVADIASLALALFAAWFSNLSSSPRKTFGFYRLEIIAAFLNSIGLLFVACFILWEAIERWQHPSHVEIQGGLMLGSAVVGLLINFISAWLLAPAKEFSLNVKGALLHIVTDIMNSVGEIITAIAVLYWHVFWLDTLLSVLIAIFVFRNATHVLCEAFNILMESAPPHLIPADIQAFMAKVPGVTDVHDLHIWRITTGKDALLAHVRVLDSHFSHETLRHLEHTLREHFGLCHITIQLEPSGFEEESILF